jgi:hypothetical protein
MPTRRDVLRMAMGAPIGAMALPSLWAASREFWEAKPASEWSSNEIDRLLTKSPWAMEVSATFNGSGGHRGGGGSRRGSGGIGFPGGGIGFPGGGYPGGGYPGGGRTGGGYPGGGYPGGGYPGAGGYPEGGGRNPGGGRETFHGTIRWESALPIQEALRIDPNDKPNPDFTKYYVLHLLGDFPAMGRRRNRDNDSSGRDGGDRDGSDRDNDAQNERRQEMFKDNTRLERKDGFIRVEKVEDGSRIGNLGPGTFFYFSRLDDLSMDDKQVQFVTKMGPVEIKAKFTFKEMLYKGKLAI